ncbi:putative Competence protein ComEC [Candidatus Promineifilum breve]|uniref:Competence protein ComEC n=1 Tax=Candidatus Promineifilum breve TaxID=1806508 RepID=A0A160T4G4_9CHLR|nr:DNA internalization-related competence protein ComEC/Rec2 [Candidatus Promineifilum breve]CUS05161.2 putative Competence protein ComEC [Candidatus Promineifilum breve]
MRSPIAAQLPRSATAAPAVDSRFYLAPVGGIGWLAGIWLAARLDLPVVAWLAVALPVIAGAILWWRRGRVGLALAACGAMALGGARYVASLPVLSPAIVQYYNGAQDVVILGRVMAEPERDDHRARLRIAASELVSDGRARPVAGALLVETNRYPAIPYGATVRLRGDLDAPIATGSPSYAAYLERQGLGSLMSFPAVEIVATGGGSPLYRAMLGLKARGRAAIVAALPEPHAALLTGILLGDDSGLPRDLTDDFRATGMTHIIAISGFNIAVIIGLLDLLTAPALPRRTAAVVIMILIFAYAALVGATASVVRAAIMGATYLAGLRLLGRPSLAVAGLFTAAFLMTLAGPNTLWDVGFQLSFAATLGLMLFAGPWSRRVDRGVAALFAADTRPWIAKWTTELLIVTLAAQVLTVPLLLYHFGRFSPASLPANLLALPVQPLVMFTGGLTMVAGAVWPAAGPIVAPPAWLFLDYTIGVIHLLARLPGASLPLTLSGTGLVAVYALIAAGVGLAAVARRPTVAVSLRRPTTGRILAGVVIIAVAAGLAVAWNAQRPDGRLHVAFLDVGQGDAILIQTPGGRQLLVDGGYTASDTLDQLGRHMPFWDRSIDLVIATHPDADHVAGLVEVVERYRIGGLITNGAVEANDSAYAALLAAAESRGVLVHPAQIGETVGLDEGVELRILHTAESPAAADDNEASVVARLTYGELSLLLTGDAEEAAEAGLLDSHTPLASVILKAGHHGADTSSSAAFLQAVAPQIVIISAGRENRYGHPHPAMLARAAAIGATVLRTDEYGTLEVTSDGARMWWSAEREAAPVP